MQFLPATRLSQYCLRSSALGYRPDIPIIAIFSSERWKLLSIFLPLRLSRFVTGISPITLTGALVVTDALVVCDAKSRPEATRIASSSFCRNTENRLIVGWSKSFEFD